MAYMKYLSGKYILISIFFVMVSFACTVHSSVIAEWKFEYNSANPAAFYADSSGNGHTLQDCALNGSVGASPSSSPLPPVAGDTYCANFAGGNCLQTVSTLDLSSYKQIRVSFWMRNTLPDSIRWIFNTSSTGTSMGGVGSIGADLNENGAGVGRAYLSSNGGYWIDSFTHDNPATIGTGVWDYYQIEYRLDAATNSTVIQVYRNGVMESTDYQTQTAALPSGFRNENWFLGGANMRYYGQLDDFKIESIEAPSNDSNGIWSINTSNASDPLWFTFGGTTLHVLQGLGPVFAGGIGPINYTTQIQNVSLVDGYTVLQCSASYSGNIKYYYLKLKSLSDNSIELLVEGQPNEVERFQCGNIYGTSEMFKQFYTGQRVTEGSGNQDGYVASIYWPSAGIYFYADWDADWTNGYTNSSNSSSRLSVRQNFMAVNPPISCDSLYGVRSDGSRPALRERYIIRSSKNMFDAMGPVTNNPSEYREELSEMVFFDHRANNFEVGSFALNWLKDATAGRIKFYSIMQPWADANNWDASNPDAYRIPDHVTPGPQWGTKDQLNNFLTIAKSMGRAGLRCNYMFIGPNSWSIQEGSVRRAVDSTLQPAWYTDFNSVEVLAQRQESDINTDFATTAVYHDQWGTAATAGGIVNFDAAVPGSGTLSATRQYIRNICKLAKTAHNGPMGSEGMLSEFLMGEYIDTGDFQLYGVFSSALNGSYRYDFTPEYKLRRLHQLATFHSAGIGAWFYYGTWTPNWSENGFNYYYSDDEKLDAYRCCEVLYGNGGYIEFKDYVSSTCPGMRKVHALTECFTVGVVQRYYALKPIDYIEYNIDSNSSGPWQTLDQIIPAATSLAQVQAWYKRFHIRYNNGCHVWVNRGELPLIVNTEDARQYTLPQNGWLVYTEDGNVTAYTALDPVSHMRVDFSEDKNREIKYVNPRTAPSYMGVMLPTVWLDGTVHLSLENPNQTFYDAFINRCGQGTENYLLSDISGINGDSDCHTDLRDFSSLASKWLTCTDPLGVGCDKPWGSSPAGSLMTILSDNFNVISAPTNDQNADLSTRQTGIASSSSWRDIGSGNTQTGGQFDSQVIINSSKQLQIFVAGEPNSRNQAAVIIAGQRHLPQSGRYKLVWDMGCSNDWVMAWFNTMQPSSLNVFSALDSGILLHDTGDVYFYVAGDSVLYARLGRVGKGEKGLHRFDITVWDGTMTVNFDSGTYIASYNISNVGNGVNGIGTFAFGASPSNVTGYLDNFSYRIPVPDHCGAAGTLYSEGDITGPDGIPDCRVDLLDVALMAQQWLICTDPAMPSSCLQ